MVEKAIDEGVRTPIRVPSSGTGGRRKVPRPSRRVRRPRGRLLAAALALLAAPALAGEEGGADAPPALFAIDPRASRVELELGATLHTVEGRVPLVRGRIRFHPEGGPASGEVVLDARGVDTGIDRRDRTMHETVLESERYPEIVLRPERLEVLERSARSAEVRLHGALAIHGGTHAVVLPARVEAEDGRLRARGRLTVPYVEWGMKDPSTFLLRVAKEVEVRFEAAGRVEGMALPADQAARVAPALPSSSTGIRP